MLHDFLTHPAIASPKLNSPASPSHAGAPLMSLLRNHWKLLALLAVGLALALRFTVFRPDADSSRHWLTAKTRLGDVEDVVLANGVLRPNKLVNVGAQVSGQVKALHVRLGETVKRGQLIAEIDPTPQQNSLRDERASIAVMQAQRAARIAALEQAKANLARQQTMMREDATSRQELQAARAQFTSARSELAVLEAQLRQAGIKLETAHVNLGYTRIVAPMDGVVVAIVTEAGQTLNSVQSAPTVVKLASLDPMLVEAQISEADVPRVKPGMPAWFTLLGDPDRRYATTLKSIDPGPTDLAKDTSGASGTSSAIYYNALLEVPNADGNLRISMTAKVNIVARKASDVLLVPAAALGARKPDGRYPVRVVVALRDGGQRVETRDVRIGLNNRIDAEVVSGLKAGEEVVVGEDTSAMPLEMDAPVDEA